MACWRMERGQPTLRRMKLRPAECVLAIEPHQERCLWSDGLDGRYVLLEKFDAKLADARHFSTSPCVI